MTTNDASTLNDGLDDELDDEPEDDPRDETPEPKSPKSLVAIVGRPNVGKSSLFNALIGRRTAIVSDVSGTTRDRLTADVEYRGRRMLMVDTGGLVADPETEIEAHIAAQVHTALDGADVILFITDARSGATYADEVVAEQLRRTDKPVVLAANKVDNSKQEALALESYALGLGEPIPISALHRRGLDDLLDQVVDALPPELPPEIETITGAHIAILGRPNVGKSALANAIIGEERSIVSEVAGTTRDALDSVFEFEGETALLIDTAGIRRRGAIQPGIERYSVMRAVRAIDRSDVAVLVLDVTELATDQDLHIAGQVMEGFKGAVVAVNKWDLAERALTRDQRSFRRLVLSRLRFMASTPVVFISALYGQGIDQLLRTVFEVHRKRMEWLPPGQLSRTVMAAIAKHLPPAQATGSLRLYRVKQEAVGPPHFVFYCNNPDRVHFSYERYLENVIRDAFGFEGTHLKLEFRGKGKVHVIGQNRSKAVARKPKAPARKAPARKAPARASKAPPSRGKRA
jgi:GTP-binding protein